MAPVTAPSTRTAFTVVSEFEPAGDQPKAITQLAEGIDRGDRFQTLLGITGSGKSATIAWTIERNREIFEHYKLPYPAEPPWGG